MARMVDQMVMPKSAKMPTIQHPVFHQQHARRWAQSLLRTAMRFKDPQFMKAAGIIQTMAGQLGTQAPPTMGTQAAPTLGTQAPMGKPMGS